MTNRKMRDMENRIRQAMEKPYEPSDERIEEIKQRAFEEYQRYVNTHELANEKHEKRAQRKRSILRRVVVVAAVTVCFFVMSIVYIALQPSITANADGLFRQAVIWINDQLHLSIVVNDPLEVDEQLMPGEHRSFSSIQELKNTGYQSIICLPESEELVADEIELFQLSNTAQQVIIRYALLDKNMIVIKIDPYNEKNGIIVDTSLTKSIETAVGKLYLWSDTNYCYALCLTDESIINITSSLPLEDLERYCKQLIKI